jgi:inhibitor of KinA sporulation pathway (predicted exonuclease)
VSTGDGFVASARADLRGAGSALLIDLEFTCWEDSLGTDWADPARPAEVIEIGLAAYDVVARTVTGSFTTLVRPRVNPILSDYCHELLHIPQCEIDAAAELPAVLADLERWLRGLPAQTLPTCGWGARDRTRLATNAAMRGVPDPLAGRRHLDLRAVMTALVHHPTPIDRDELRALTRLPPNPRRHRALDDALDLIHFLALLFAPAARSR